VADFHAANRERRRRWPGEMLATTTHDTKRSEDARARLNVLSEMPDAWSAAVATWRRINAPNCSRVAGLLAPDAGDEYLFYQALLAAWPIQWHRRPPPRVAPELVSRLTAYMAKAIKEAKRHTSWITPNIGYESGLARFIERSLTGPTAPAFLTSFLPFAARIATAGMVNSLAQLVLKIGSPGVADFYQGVELWDQSLVDPDNRRPVDFECRRRLLGDLEPWLATDDAAPGSDRAAAVTSLIDSWPDGRIKLFVSALGMRLRRRRPALFLDGDYRPLVTRGPAADHVIAFERAHGRDSLIVLAPRLTASLATASGVPLGREAWRSTSVDLPTRRPSTFRELLTGARLEAIGGLSVSDVFAVCPVAILLADPPDG
jgi:(1->4)-alpha-D-glucan 1-alpha-D-glucosylmutase